MFTIQGVSQQLCRVSHNTCQKHFPFIDAKSSGMETKDLLPLFCRGEKSGELGQPVCVIFFPNLCYFSAYRHFTSIYDILSNFFANIRRSALILGVLDIFFAKFAEAKIALVLICTFFSCLLF